MAPEIELGKAPEVYIIKTSDRASKQELKKYTVQKGCLSPSSTRSSSLNVECTGY